MKGVGTFMQQAFCTKVETLELEICEKKSIFNLRTLKVLHYTPGRLTWNIQITHLERKMIFQTSMIMFHVNLQGCNRLDPPFH